MKRKLPDLKTDAPQLPEIESKYISQIPFAFAAIGQCKSGKTHLCFSILKLLRKEKSITKIYLCSPSVKSNTLYNAVLTPDDWIFEDTSTAVWKWLEEVEKDIDAAAERYADQLLHAIAYKKFVNGDHINPADENLLELYGYRHVEPVRPSPVLVLDDCSHSALYSSSAKNRLVHMCLRHRHCAQGLGLSLAFCVQTYRTGVPKAIRGNLSHLSLFHTESLRDKRAMYDEVCGQCSWAEFERMFNLYTDEPHAYMWVDMVRRTLEDSF